MEKKQRKSKKAKKAFYVYLHYENLLGMEDTNDAMDIHTAITSPWIEEATTWLPTTYVQNPLCTVDGIRQ